MPFDSRWANRMAKDFIEAGKLLETAGHRIGHPLENCWHRIRWAAAEKPEACQI